MENTQNNLKILLVNKPLHWTSNDVIQKIKHKYHIKKIGHAGTLDPLATGLLILGINEGTKEINNLMLKEKVYLANIVFNYETDTNDNEGKVIAYQKKDIKLDEIIKSINHFKNEIYEQTPPIYSSVKINGVRAYKLARNNKNNIVINPKIVKLIDYKIISFKNNELVIELKTSKGFYVRSFARDLGRSLNNFANLTKLVRIQIGEYTINQSYKLEELDDILN
ncbi:MAG: tRNA pseudouridine(55) synthase TruB [Ureaplasma sp.]|nr:tRNA pseudouridine(55) synthase TruB [Ureaplasma sp.]